MALINILFRKDGCPFPSCELGQSSLMVGEKLKITLQPKNPLWPEFIIGELTDITKDSLGFDYTIQFDDADLNGGPQFQGCDIEVEPFCCCDKLDLRVTALEELTGDIHVLEGQTVIPDENGIATIIVVGDNEVEQAPVTLDLSSLLDNTDDHVVAGQTVIPDENGIAIIQVEDKDGNSLDSITLDLSSLLDDTFSQLIGNTDGTATFINADGTTGVGVILAPPVGTPLNYVPKPNGLGGVVWVADEVDDSCCEDTTYQFIRAGNNLVITSSGDCDPVTLIDIFAVGAGGVSDGNTTYTYVQSGADLVITPSDGTTPTTLTGIFTDSDGDTTYTYEQFGDDLVITPSDGTTPTTLPSIFAVGDGTTYTYVQSGADLIITPSNGDPAITLNDVFTTPVTYEFERVGDDLIVTPSNGDPATTLVDVYATGGDCNVDVVEVTEDTVLDTTFQNKLVRVNSSTDVTITLPANDPLMTTAFVCSVSRVGTGGVTFVGESGVVIESIGVRIFNRFQGIAVHFINTNRFQIYGDLF